MTRLLATLILATLFAFSLAARAGEGALTVKTEPRDAAIYLDGKLKAEGSPAVLRARPGRHTLEARKAGFKTAREEVFVGEDAVVVKTLRLAVDVPVEVPVAQTDKPGYYLFPERDPFETPAEFEARKKQLLKAFNARSANNDPAFAAGKATLLKEQYDIEKGRFPVKLALKDWAKRLLVVVYGPYLPLDRDAARVLYRAGAVQPVYLHLGADGLESELRVARAGGDVRVRGVETPAMKEKHEREAAAERARRAAAARARREAAARAEARRKAEQAKAEAKRKARQANAEARRYGFQVKWDGTVLDTRTGLMWKRCAEGQSGFDCNGRAARYTWDDAMSRFKGGVRFAGYDDWRMPTIEELRTLVWCSNGTPQEETWDHQCDGDPGAKGGHQIPTIVTAAFPNTLWVGFWSASPAASRSGSAWTVDFGSGGSDDWAGRSSPLYVRLVRAGQ